MQAPSEKRSFGWSLAGRLRHLTKPPVDMIEPAGVLDVTMRKIEQNKPLQSERRENSREAREVLESEKPENRWIEEIKLTGEIGWPATVLGVCRSLFFSINLAALGNLSSPENREMDLGGAALGGSIFNVTGNSLMVGMAGALETLCGQAYGAGDFKALSVYAQRAMGILTALSLPIFFLWFQSKALLDLIGQSGELGSRSYTYLCWMMPAMILNAGNETFTRYLQTQRIIYPQLYATILSLLLHIPIVRVLIWKFGLIGAAVSVSISSAINLLTCIAIVLFRGQHNKTWSGWTVQAFRKWPEFLRLAIPSASMLCLEWWAFEICVLLCAWLPNNASAVASTAILNNIVSLLFNLPLGISVAASTRVSNELGAGNASSAKIATLFSSCLSLIVATISLSLTYYFRDSIMSLFTQNQELKDFSLTIFPILILLCVGDAFQGVFSGTFRGAGLQTYGTAINVIIYYMIALPLGSLMAFQLGMGAKGLWTGLAIGTNLQGLIMGGFLLSIFDWKATKRRPSDRRQTDQIEQQEKKSQEVQVNISS